MQQQVLRETEQRKALEDEIKELRKEIDVVRNCDHIFLQLSRVFECVPLCAPVCPCVCVCVTHCLRLLSLFAFLQENNTDGTLVTINCASFLTSQPLTVCHRLWHGRA